MPTYVYRCRDCQEQMEAIQRFSDAPLTICPYCGGTLQRLLFPPAIIFKGSGWYVTDNRSSSPGNGSARKAKEPEESKVTSGKDEASPSDTTSSGPVEED